MKREDNEERLEEQALPAAPRPKRTRRRRNRRRQIRQAYLQRGVLVLAAVLCVVLGARGVSALTSRSSTPKKSGTALAQPVSASQMEGNGLTAAAVAMEPLGITVVLDAGHGGTQPGCVIGGLEEKEIAMSIIQRLKTKLEGMGFDVVLTRGTDVNVGLSERAQIANQAGGDCFVSIHCNSYVDDSISGLECYYYRSEEGEQLAEAISTATKAGQIATRESKEGNFQVLREADMPAVLIEAGYMTNPAELELLASEDHQQDLADAIADGIWAMLGENR